MSEEQQHECIYLQPWCDGCERHASGTEGRLWCQDDVWDDCEECGRKSVKYVLATSAHPSPDAK